MIMLVFVFHFESKSLYDNEHIVGACIISKDEVVLAGCEEVIESGQQFYYYTSSDFKKFAHSFSSIDGVVLYFGDYSIEALVKDYNIDYFQGGDVDGNEVYYGYTPYYRDSISVQNKKVNVQIIVQADRIIAGFPAVLTGF